MVAGLIFLHSNGIIHRDLAARNLLVKEEDNKLSVKIADLGLAYSVVDQEKDVSELIPVIFFFYGTSFRSGGVLQK